jgi:predicted PurR-regulated permease PerM
MTNSSKWALWIIATGVIAAGLYWFRDWLTQFALALILWLAIDGLAQWLDERVPNTPRWLALPVAIVLVLSLVAVVGVVVTRNVTEIAGRIAGQGARLSELVGDVYRLVGLAGPPPTLDTILGRADPAALLTTIGAALQRVVSDAVFILIYLGFLFSAAAQFPRKLDLVFRRREQRERARLVLTEIRSSMEKYLLVQTIMSLIITALTLVTLLIIGMPNALFWAFLIFFLNYIPTIGSLLAVVLTALAATVEFATLGPVAAVAAGVGFWQFAIGNFLQPRFTGDSLNLSAVVVLLALALWGALWGIAGAFLAAPITVALMVALAQNEATRPIAIMLSADGKPKIFQRTIPDISISGRD